MISKTLREIYDEQKKLPTPANAFITMLCKVTHRQEMTVRGWLSGKYRPDINTRIIIAQHLKADANALFPPKTD